AQELVAMPAANAAVADGPVAAEIGPALRLVGRLQQALQLVLGGGEVRHVVVVGEPPFEAQAVGENGIDQVGDFLTHLFVSRFRDIRFRESSSRKRSQGVGGLASAEASRGTR